MSKGDLHFQLFANMSWVFFYIVIVIVGLARHSNTSTAKIAKNECKSSYELLFHKFLSEESKHQIKPFIISKSHITVEECHEYCDHQARCRGVGYMIGTWNKDIGLEYRCELHNVNIQELVRKGEWEEIKTGDASYLLYDRNMPCECPAGQESRRYPEEVYCTPCSKHFFKAAVGIENCTKCVDGKVSNDKTTCECPAGKEPREYPKGVSCTPCSENFFKAFFGSEKCTQCVDGKVSNDKTTCDCPAGKEPRGYPDEVACTPVYCTPCSENFFKASVGSGNCTQCVHGKVSNDKTTCECPAGKEPRVHQEKVSCTPCSKGFFKASVGSEDCIHCVKGKVSYDNTTCECPAGKEPRGYPKEVSCTSCSGNFFKASVGSEKCTQCVDGKVSNDKTTCECPAGKEPRRYAEKVYCTPCLQGFFKAYGGSENCTQCVYGKVSNDKTTCECPAGQEPRDHPGKVYCTPCSERFFKASVGSENCTQCVDGKVSTHKTTCECPPGQEPRDYRQKISCKTCLAGFFKAPTGSEDCTPCADGVVSRDKISCNRSAVRHCGQPSIRQKFGYMRIIGGIGVRPGSWPWQISIKFGTPNYFVGYLCGGTIISDRWILTAAHCFEYSRSACYYAIRVGDFDELEEDVFEVTHQVKSIIVHENYDDYTFDNDIALIEVEDRIQFNDYVSHVCLPNHDDPLKERDNVYITGFGKTHGTYDDVLKQATVPVRNWDECSKTYGEINIPLTENMFCAGNGGMDTCQGDSGGPLVYKSGGSWSIHGITSWGMSCADKKYPGVYAKVVNYLDWIENKMMTTGPEGSVGSGEEDLGNKML